MVHTCLHDYLKSLLCFTVVCLDIVVPLGKTPFIVPSPIFLQCLTVPTVAISAIMVAAYKKFILVSLLKFGKVRTPLVLS